ncbi:MULTISPECIES: hypothetical protein [unclassified Ruegeria]|uniref:hypothetical protein n=1 Tax=unclassified Ruegeria TaxID=2625375 RepID=UPI00147DD5F0|nr:MULTISPECIES: hypothetical protein [unclassified Ruegeria]NOD35875.1 hypothetical protein [Ruegeria sp. HKCCD7296]NOE40078.1 hypothetical protein [Ruegeria sp. HKCCD7319]
MSITGCVEISQSNEDIVAPSGMVEECTRQIRVGRPYATISIREVITAGPDNRVFVGMMVDGESWGCREEDNGIFTAFSQFAN